MVTSVFHKPRRVDGEMLRYYKAKFAKPTVEEGVLAHCQRHARTLRARAVEEGDRPDAVGDRGGRQGVRSKTASRRRATCPTVTSARS